MVEAKDVKCTASLYPYQEEGVEWCIKTEKNGTILAYDMGMGKTIVTCALITRKPVKTIIMVPASILNQWYNELTTFTTGLNIKVYHGPNRKYMTPYLIDADVILTTAHIIANDIEKNYIKAFDRWVIDEAHKLRNEKGTIYQRLQIQSGQVLNKVFLTGTPICNKPMDIVSLICLGNLKEYNSLNFWKNIDMNNKLKMINEATSLILLRKKKEECISNMLPKIETKEIIIKMNKGKQMELYDSYLSEEQILKRILRMRQSVNKLNEELSATEEAKIREINTILTGIPKDDKVIVFSYFTSFLKHLKSKLSIDEKNISIFHGKLSLTERNELVEKFKKEEESKIMLINLRCGGCGLNLIEANHVILVEPYWNESEHQQAINRVYRIGQQKPVKIYKLLVKNSIETWLSSMQLMKDSISKYIVDKDETVTWETLLEKQLKVALMFKTLGHIAMENYEDESVITELEKCKI